MTDRQDQIHFAIPQITDDDVDAVVRVLRSGWLTTGDECSGLEHDLSEHLGGSHVVAVSSGTAALDIAIAALHLRPGARVGVPAWTFVATALAAVHNGLRPVLLDVDAATLNLSPAALAADVDDLDAVIPVHFGGVPVDPRIHEIAADAAVPVIEDAAHALGARDERGLVGAPGTGPACFSFYASKNLTSGEGGALATDDAELAAFARSHRLHGMDADAWARYRPGARSGYDVVQPGIKANLPDVLAVLARSQLARFDAMQRRRRAIVDRYRANLAGTAIRVIPPEQVRGSADHLMVVELPSDVERSAVVDALNDEGISTSVHFRPLHHFTWFRSEAAIGRTGLATCDELADRVMSLPLHVLLTDDDVDRVSTALSKAAGSWV